MNPRYGILSTTLALTVASTACGAAGSSQPTLALSESNATSVAAEVLNTTGQTSTVLLPGGFTPGMVATFATGLQHADGTMTTPCAVSGNSTVTVAGTATTITFDHCIRDASAISGTIHYTAQQSSTPSVSLTASFDVTFTWGSLISAESGGFTLTATLAQNSSSTEYELTGHSLSISLSVDGTLRDQLTVSDFDTSISRQLTPIGQIGQEVGHFTRDLDSSWLNGRISIMTTQDIQQLLTRRSASTGQILISGANHTRLQITILGDEAFTPPAGQGQIELQIDPGTGAFGAPIWTSWVDLSAMVSTVP
jgi:hypothetical protein